MRIVLAPFALMLSLLCWSVPAHAQFMDLFETGISTKEFTRVAEVLSCDSPTDVVEILKLRHSPLNVRKRDDLLASGRCEMLQDVLFKEGQIAAVVAGDEPSDTYYVLEVSIFDATSARGPNQVRPLVYIRVKPKTLSANPTL